MDWQAALRDRRVVLGIGGGLALLLGLGIAIGIMAHDKGDHGPPPASRGGLVVEMGRDDDAKLDPKKQLRCFVGGQFVGLATLNECAKRNGVATQALDVGVDESGALAASGQAGTVLTPLPPSPAQIAAPAPVQPAPTAPLPAPAAQRGPVGACWRYAGGGWQRLPEEMTLASCARTLFAGKCERAGGATYGRWDELTLRLVPGRVEQSNDDRNFRTLVEQTPGCGLP